MKYFNKQLNNFIGDFANGGAINHLTDLGYSVSEIKQRLDYPMDKSEISRRVWQHLVDTGKIRLEQPKGEFIEKISYEKVQGEYGRSSMRQVVERIEKDSKEYIPCDFGKRMYKDRQGFINAIDSLPDKEKEYILDMPWPLTTIYHEKDERVQKVIDILNKK